MAADDALKRGDQDAANFMTSIRKLEGSQTAALAAQGIEISRGSAADIRAETIDTGLEDMSTIRTNANAEAFGYRQQAIDLESQARRSRIARKFAAKQVKIETTAKAANSLSGTATNIGKAGSA